FVKEKEAKQLLKTAITFTDDWNSLNAKMLLLIFYNTGMRRAELINLKERNIDAAKGQIKVLGKGNKERIIPVTKELLHEIDDYIQQKKRSFEEQAEELLVTEKGKKLYPKYVYLLVKKYLSQAATLDKKSPHVLRH